MTKRQQSFEFLLKVVKPFKQKTESELEVGDILRLKNLVRF